MNYSKCIKSTAVQQRATMSVYILNTRRMCIQLYFELLSVDDGIFQNLVKG